jgi:DNA-binding transcriptional ArsR family regulator
MNRADLILHPVRFRILESLGGESLTTQDIADRLPDVPKSTIYRQIKLLLDGGMIAVDETRPVRGVLEKTYRLDQPLRLGIEDMADVTPQQHIHYFQAYAMTLVQGFTNYVNATAVGDKVDMLAHRSGYSEAFVYATTAELDEAFAAFNQALMALATNLPGEGRHRHKFAIITHPE